mgnify:CR=1 FL=1
MDSGLKSVTILGKSLTGRECPFDTEEIWGINNVAGDPFYCGGLESIKLINGGKGYISPPEVSFVGDGQEVKAEAIIKDGAIVTINVQDTGRGFTAPPKVVFLGDGSGAEAAVTISPLRKFHKLFAFDILEKGYTDGMKKYAPVCSWQDYGDIKYPLQDVIKEFNTKYFTNTVAYMLAYVAYLKIPLCKVYGVDVTFGAPYAQENRGVEYWIGRAQERGVNVFVPDESQLMRTVSGALYGERDHCNLHLYLHERINLINILPRQGHYSDSIKAQNAWWVLFPKEDEAKAHNIQLTRNPDGSMSFNCRQEYLYDCHMPPETWEYIRGILRDIESKGQLPFSVISAYEKLILSKPDGGN